MLRPSMRAGVESKIEAASGLAAEIRPRASTVTMPTLLSRINCSKSESGALSAPRSTASRRCATGGRARPMKKPPRPAATAAPMAIRSPASTSFLEHVPAAAHGDDVTRLVGVDFDLLAQPAHVHADRLMLALEVVAPDFVEQRLARHDAPAVLHQHREQAELFGRERDGLAAHGQRLARRIEHDVARFDHLAAQRLRGAAP